MLGTLNMSRANHVSKWLFAFGALGSQSALCEWRTKHVPFIHADYKHLISLTLKDLLIWAVGFHVEIIPAWDPFSEPCSMVSNSICCTAICCAYVLRHTKNIWCSWCYILAFSEWQHSRFILPTVFICSILISSSCADLHNLSGSVLHCMLFYYDFACDIWGV